MVRAVDVLPRGGAAGAVTRRLVLGWELLCSPADGLGLGGKGRGVAEETAGEEVGDDGLSEGMEIGGLVGGGVGVDVAVGIFVGSADG